MGMKTKYNYVVPGQIETFIVDTINYVGGQNIIAIPAVFGGVEKNLTLTSGNDLSGTNFTITGISNNIVTTETLAGPLANTITTDNTFSQVMSIIPDNTDNGLSIGIGDRAIVAIPLNVQSESFVGFIGAWGLSWLNNGGDFSVSVNLTYNFDKINPLATVINNPISFFIIVANDVTDSNFVAVNETAIADYILVIVTSNNAAETNLDFISV